MTFTNANLAELVDVPPRRKSCVPILSLIAPLFSSNGEPPLATGRIPEMYEAPPARFRAEDERTPDALLWRTPTPPRLEKVMVPLEVMPVAAAIAPELLTWNPDPTEKRDVGLVFPMPTLPLVRAVNATVPFGARTMLPVLAAPRVKD